MTTNEPRNVEPSGRQHSNRARPARRRPRQNIGIIAIIVGFALIIVGLIAIPQILAANNASTVAQITPIARPQANGLAAGDPNAKIKIDVYEDFQCPYCRIYSEQTESQLMKNEVAAGKAYYVYHHFLIIDGPTVTWASPQKESHQAANASMCAADQNRFWDFHDILFANQNGENAGSFTDARLVAFAQALDLDMGKFNTCFSSNAHKAQIDADVALATSLGIGGTPTVLVNGKDVAPNKVPSYAEIQAAIAAVK